MVKAFFVKMKDKIKKSVKSDDDKDFSDDIVEEEGYVELNSSQKSEGDKNVVVRPFILEEFTDVKPILDVLREGSTICLVNIKPIKDKDVVELKRAINKLKKTCDAVDGDIAGFGEDWIVVAPSFVSIYRDAPAAPQTPAGNQKQQAQFDDDEF